MESNVQYFIDNNIIRAKYKHLYLINGTLEFLTTNKKIKINPIISHSNSNAFILHPITKVFENNTLLKTYVYKNVQLKFAGITCFFTNYYDSHVGHGLFDSLYPIYHCFLRAGYIDEPFNILYQLGNFSISNKNKEIFKTFSKTNNFLSFENLIKQSINCKFDEIIVGSYGAGLSCTNETVILMGNDINAMQKFRNRMLAVYQINSNKNNTKINTAIIDNKRYSEATKKLLTNLCNYLNKIGNFNCKYVNYRKIPEFKYQLELINSTDIHISGPGTGMLNFPFLRDNSRHINLGTKNSGGVEGAIGYMEYTITSHVENYINCEFYDIIKYKKILFNELLKLIINKDIEKIVTPDYIKIWREYCKVDNINMKNIIARMNSTQIPYRFPEILVQEKGPFKENIENPNMNLISHKLLRKIKNKYN